METSGVISSPVPREREPLTPALSPNDRGAGERHFDRLFCQKPRAQKMLRRFVAETAAACRAFEATFWTISSDGASIDGAAGSGANPQIIESVSVPAGDSVVGLVANTGIAACIGPGDYQNPSVAALTGVQVHAMLVAPVRCGGSVCGVLSAVNPDGGGVFDPGALEMLQWKAYLLGLLLADLSRDGAAA